MAAAVKQVPSIVNLHSRLCCRDETPINTPVNGTKPICMSCKTTAAQMCKMGCKYITDGQLKGFCFVCYQKHCMEQNFNSDLTYCLNIRCRRSGINPNRVTPFTFNDYFKTKFSMDEILSNFSDRIVAQSKSFLQKELETERVNATKALAMLEDIMDISDSCSEEELDSSFVSSDSEGYDSESYEYSNNSDTSDSDYEWKW